MNPELVTLILSTMAISFIHTASGPDHYLPFIVLSKSKKWSLTNTIFWTSLCGMGHVLSSVLIGFIGIFLGWQLTKLDWFQSIRGNITGWSLFSLGIVYLIWGLYKAYTNKAHKHFDVYDETDIYVYSHKHGEIVNPKSKVKITPWILFAIFVMGPSEPIVPLLFYSGATRSAFEILLIITAFTLTTVLSMVAMVLLGYYGNSFIKTDAFERYSYAISGAVVTICGTGMLFFNW
jgi:sulfite exporter TauE/SafE